ncbi:hypothetical protein BJX96DRAFT_125112 [Aspergillus floccosus]
MRNELSRDKTRTNAFHRRIRRKSASEEDWGLARDLHFRSEEVHQGSAELPVVGKLLFNTSAVVLHIPDPFLPTDAPSRLSDTQWRVCQHSSSHQAPSDLLNITLDRSQGPSDITGQVSRPAHLLSRRSGRKFQVPSPFFASQETLQIFRKLGPDVGLGRSFPLSFRACWRLFSVAIVPGWSPLWAVIRTSGFHR